MKKLVRYALALIPFIALSQAPERIHFQALLSEPSSSFGNDVTVTIQVKSDPNSQLALFNEQQTVAVGNTGLLSFDIGTSSDLSQVDWSTGSHFLEISVNGESLGTSQIVNVPYALYASEAGSINMLDYDDLINAPDFSNADTDVSDDFDGDYASLENTPSTISTAQSDETDLLTATTAVNLDDLNLDIATNNMKATFPGFGTVSGTAFIQKWSKVNDNLYLPEGGSGIGVASTSDPINALNVNAATKVSRLDPAAATPGMLYLDQTSGTFKFYNENNEIKDLISTDVIEFANGVENIREVNIGGDLVVGSFETPLADATLTISSATPIIRFDDTSSSSSFPRNDWEVRANDIVEGGEDYFAIVDITNDLVPFKVSPAVPTNTLFMDSNGDVKIGGNNPTSRLDVEVGEVRGLAFVGNASGLTGLSGMGGSSVQNTGSTTIAADNDANNDGSVLFETASTNRMTLDDRGHVGIGTAPGEEVLNVSGSSIPGEISIDPVNFDVTGTRVIVFDTAPGGFLSPTTSEIGQELIIINRSATAFNVFHSPGFTNIPQFGSITLVWTSVGWVVKYRSI